MEIQETPAPIESVPVTSDEPISAHEAARSVAQYRYKRDAQAEREETPTESAEPAAPTDSSQEEPAAPAEATGEQATETTEPAVEPPIEPPRSWTKEEKEEFATYPREAQEKIARREQDRETALRRGQNETADERKAIQAEREKVEQARKQYEEALPALLQTLHQQQQGDFSDIKSIEDVKRLAREDWPRYALWDAQQKQIALVSQEVEASRSRQVDEYRVKWSEFAAKEDARFADLAPEMADKDKATKIADAAVGMLKEIGFADTELAKAWNGEASVSLRDHRVQLLIRDAARYRAAQAAAPKKIVTPIPQVQRPGAAQPKGADATARLTNLDKQLENSGSVKDAVALLSARRASR